MTSGDRLLARHFRFGAYTEITNTVDAGSRGSSYFWPAAAPKKKDPSGLLDGVKGE